MTMILQTGAFVYKNVYIKWHPALRNDIVLFLEIKHSSFCCALLCVLSSFAIILKRKSDLVTLLLRPTDALLL